MEQINSDKTSINAPIEKIFDFLSDFNNFHTMMPEQVKNWTSTAETCSFEVSGMGTLALKITEKVPYSKILIVPDTGTKLPFTFELICQLDKIADKQTEVIFVFEHEMPMMIRLMASRPLQNLVNILAAKLKEYCESAAF